MKKLVVLLLVILTAGIASAADYKANVYQETTYVNVNQTTKTVSFPAPSRTLIVMNSDSAEAVWVNIKEASAPVVQPAVDFKYSGAFLLPAGKDLTFENYVCSGVGLKWHLGEASPVTVIATY